MLKKFEPKKLLFLSIFTWFFFFCINSGSYFNLGNFFFPISTLILFNLSFVIGTKTIKTVLPNRIKINPITRKDYYIIFLTFILGSIGVFIRLYQRVFIQKLLSTENSFESRLKLLESGSNPGILALISALLFPFAFIALAYATFYVKSISRTKYVLIFSFGIYPIIDSFFYQGRLAIVLYSLMLLIVVILRVSIRTNKLDYLIKVKLKNLTLISFPRYFSRKKVIFIFSIVVITFLSFFIHITSQRYAKYNFEEHLAFVEFHQENKFSDDLIQTIKTSSNPYYHMSKYNLIHYMTHGVMEYIKMVNHVGNPFGTYYGQYEFNVYFKALRVLGLPLKPYAELSKVLDRTGVYTTFWGDFYLDFGLFGLLIIFLMGRYVKKVYNKAISGNIISILFYCYFSVVILGSPYINLLSGSLIYYLNALFITALFYKLMPNKFFKYR